MELLSFMTPLTKNTLLISFSKELIIFKITKILNGINGDSVCQPSMKNTFQLPTELLTKSGGISMAF